MQMRRIIYHFRTVFGLVYVLESHRNDVTINLHFSVFFFFLFRSQPEYVTKTVYFYFGQIFCSIHTVLCYIVVSNSLLVVINTQSITTGVENNFKY